MRLWVGPLILLTNKFRDYPSFGLSEIATAAVLSCNGMLMPVITSSSTTILILKMVLPLVGQSVSVLDCGNNTRKDRTVSPVLLYIWDNVVLKTKPDKDMRNKH